MRRYYGIVDNSDQALQALIRRSEQMTLHSPVMPWDNNRIFSRRVVFDLIFIFSYGGVSIYL
jgi:hypothetical protein